MRVLEHFCSFEVCLDIEYFVQRETQFFENFGIKETGRSDDISHVNLVAMECVGKTTTLLRCGCNIVILLTALNSLFILKAKEVEL